MIYIATFLGTLVHLLQKLTIAHKKPDFHIKIFFYKMWPGTLLNLVSAYSLVITASYLLPILFNYLVPETWKEFTDTDLLYQALINFSCLVVGYKGNSIFNKFIRNGPVSTEKAKQEYELD